jgi:hypothetical protein
MAALPPPEGMTEEDYDSIHAAVVETVRGRWFLAEYARRSRVDEVREMLDAISRLETVVTSSRALPPGDASPHLRLVAQRASEIAASLAAITEDLRESGADPYLCDDLESQIRAIAGLQKSAPLEPQLPAAASPLVASDIKPAIEPPQPSFRETAPEIRQDRRQDDVISVPKAAHASEPAPVAPSLPRAAPFHVSSPVSPQGEDPRLAALAALDRLSLTEKLALFS